MTLLFCYWYEYLQNDFSEYNHQIIEQKNKYIKWFYTTSGYYDKNINSYYMNAKHENNIDPENYKKYFNLIYNFIKCSNFCYPGIHFNKNTPVFKSFYKSLNFEREHWYDYFFNKIKNYKLLVISPFAELFKKQYKSGNCHKIYDNFPKLKRINFYSNIYTFLNKGPHNNIFETVDFLVNEIQNKHKEKKYNMVVISAGAYSTLLAEKFYNLNKNVFVLGGELQGIFGIMSNRQKQDNQLNIYNPVNISYESNQENKKYWITEIPDKYKPHDYMKIENGCYW